MRIIAKIDLVGRIFVMIPIIILATVSHIIFMISIAIIHVVLDGNSIANDIMYKINVKSALKGGKDEFGSDKNKQS